MEVVNLPSFAARFESSKRRNLAKFGKRESLPTLTVTFRAFFSVSLSHLLILQIWWLLSFLQGAQSPQLSLRWHPLHSPQRLRFFLDPFS